ncbi:exodeoxyribonuclease VII large subunit [Pseudoflavonifractor sp. MSJ-37]|uniref:exodeoxyribonuclease VII large subunit n=1 Tax=Pseudoflavonifractor sp. MSJ-37 TaxID=2841531 RepID=UPI001C1142DB|nr:exodeoxyribonuclease VII large subunit [Pseudoflavonifractor sp. MSJ-37]MBU5434863.1 exodeoxyribonuclease VII large subunit [Pseudoflavonifractor sp. MSJ-37]
MSGENVYTVGQVNQYIKSLMDGDRHLAGLFIRGEISNHKTYPSGHHYFSLKDADGAIRCVMFRREAAGLRFRPQNGMKIIAFGRITVFPRDGQYQLYCDRLTADGVGDLHLAFEQCKEKLFREGLFDPAHKQPIPKFPGRIALITSPVGAAVRDMLRILNARWPMAQVLVIPVRVQGSEAPGEISAALDWADRHQAADLIITGRGGGSMEDLWAFNEEIVARSIYACRIPVISAVGHEPDVTIADFVADLRAATPSNAAELAVPDQNDVYAGLFQMERRLDRAAARTLERSRTRLEHLGERRVLRDPIAPIQDRRSWLELQRKGLAGGISAALSGEKEQMARLAAALDAMSPLKVLGRGYAIPRKEDGSLIRSRTDVASGERIDLKISDGSIRCRVERTSKD